MGRLVHPRGDLQMSIEGIDANDGMLEIVGQMGVWKARIILTPQEVWAVFRSMLRPRIIRYLLSLPWLLRARAAKNSSSSTGA